MYIFARQNWYFILSTFVAVGISVVYYWRRNSPEKQIKKKFTQIVTKFHIDDATLTCKKISGKLYDTYNCEIIIIFNHKTYHGYFSFFHSIRNIEVSGRQLLSTIGDGIQIIGNPSETHTLQCADLCMLLFFEKILLHNARDIAAYRKNRYKWNIGRLAYLPIEPTYIASPNL